MWYEEKIIDGMLCCRRAPDGEWEPKKDGMRSTIVNDLCLMSSQERQAVMWWFCRGCGNIRDGTCHCENDS